MRLHIHTHPLGCKGAATHAAPLWARKMCKYKKVKPIRGTHKTPEYDMNNHIAAFLQVHLILSVFPGVKFQKARGNDPDVASYFEPSGKVYTPGLVRVSAFPLTNSPSYLLPSALVSLPNPSICP